MHRVIATVATIISIFGATAYAKPMMPATLEEAARSPHVVIASYQSFAPAAGTNEDIYFGGVTANYKLESILKRPSNDRSKALAAPEKTLKVRYIMHDLSPCMVDQTFRFSESLMPPKGSRWILFLTNKQDNQDWDTYRGNEGRMEATDANIKRVKSLIAKGS